MKSSGRRKNSTSHWVKLVVLCSSLFALVQISTIHALAQSKQDALELLSLALQCNGGWSSQYRYETDAEGNNRVSNFELLGRDEKEFEIRQNYTTFIVDKEQIALVERHDNINWRGKWEDVEFFKVKISYNSNLAFGMRCKFTDDCIREEYNISGGSSSYTVMSARFSFCDQPTADNFKMAVEILTK